MIWIGLTDRDGREVSWPGYERIGIESADALYDEGITFTGPREEVGELRVHGYATFVSEHEPLPASVSALHMPRSVYKDVDVALALPRPTAAR